MASPRTWSARRGWIIAAACVVVAGAGWYASGIEREHFLPTDTSAFLASFPPPPAPDSPATRRELDQLLDIQRGRSEHDVEAARADRRKDVDRFYGALGFDAQHSPRLPALHALMEKVEDDVGRYIRAPKLHFARHRPYVIEPGIDPCIGDVDGDRSYPSGHAAYGYVVALLLADMVPDRRDALMARADEFARARAVCGVHFPSDLEAARRGAEWLARQFLADPSYQEAASEAAAELRDAVVSGGESRDN